LFDMLPSGTPSKRRAVLGDVELNVLQTPSRKTQDAASEASLESRARGERTPQSIGKRFMLNQFVTPQKRKVEEQGTPSSTTRGLATPAFLRRGNALGAIEEADEATPRPAPWKRRGLGRSLSAMIQAMKKDEDDKLDEEADIMREMEMEEAGISLPPKKSKAPQVLVEDSQAPMPLGPDRGLESEDEDEQPELGRDGQPRRVWKKKGLKRQTRRVISKLRVLRRQTCANPSPVRPNFIKSKPEPILQTQDDSDGEQEKVAETQATGDVEEDIDSEDYLSEYASDASHTPRKRSVPKKSTDETKDQAKEGVVKTAGRKIKASAHANFRRLKIRTAKGASGGAKGKFGRRR
jgi:hypothetical protein